MSEEKKLTEEKLKQAFFILRHGSSEGLSEYIKAVLAIENEYNRQKAEIERMKINLANEKKWGKIQAKQAEKDMARKILGELDLFFKGTTFRQGYEFKKIMEKLKEMAKDNGVEVDYEN